MAQYAVKITIKAVDSVHVEVTVKGCVCFLCDYFASHATLLFSFSFYALVSVESSAW